MAPPRSNRSRSVGTKLTEEECAQVEAAAARSGQTIAEWCRVEILHIDFLTRLGEAYSFDTLRAETLDYEGIPIRLVTAQQLYEMKPDTVRLKDKADCAALNEKFHFE